MGPDELAPPLYVSNLQMMYHGVPPRVLVEGVSSISYSVNPHDPAEMDLSMACVTGTKIYADFIYMSKDGHACFDNEKLRDMYDKMIDQLNMPPAPAPAKNKSRVKNLLRKVKI